MWTDLKKKIEDLFKSRSDTISEGDWGGYCEKYDIIKLGPVTFVSTPSGNRKYSFPEDFTDFTKHWTVRLDRQHYYTEWYLIPHDLREKALVLGQFPLF